MRKWLSIAAYALFCGVLFIMVEAFRTWNLPITGPHENGSVGKGLYKFLVAVVCGASVLLLFLFTLIVWRRLSWGARICGMLPLPGFILLLGIMRLKESMDLDQANSMLLEYQIRRSDGAPVTKPLSRLVRDGSGGIGQTFDSIQSSESGTIYGVSLETSRERFIILRDRGRGGQEEVVRRYDLQIPQAPVRQDWSSWADGIPISPSSWKETRTTSAPLPTYQVRYRVVKMRD